MEHKNPACTQCIKLQHETKKTSTKQYGHRDISYIALAEHFHTLSLLHTCWSQKKIDHTSTHSTCIVSRPLLSQRDVLHKLKSLQNALDSNVLWGKQRARKMHIFSHIKVALSSGTQFIRTKAFYHLALSKLVYIVNAVGGKINAYTKAQLLLLLYYSRRDLYEPF